MNVYKTEIEVQWPDVDCSRTIYFPRYVQWFELALFYGFLRSRGINFTDDNRMIVGSEVRGTTFVIGEYHCRINAPSKLHDLLEVHTSVREIREKTITFDFDLFKKQSDERLASGYFVLVHIDVEKWKAVKIPDDVVKLISYSSGVQRVSAMSSSSVE